MFRPCRMKPGEVSERPKERHWKCRMGVKPHRGFKSLPLRFHFPLSISRRAKPILVASSVDPSREIPCGPICAEAIHRVGGSRSIRRHPRSLVSAANVAHAARQFRLNELRQRKNRQLLDHRNGSVVAGIGELRGFPGQRVADCLYPSLMEVVESAGLHESPIMDGMSSSSQMTH